MFQVTGEKCPVCGEAFRDGDDVVFCPDCGTPHHRNCYKELGHCANEEKHAEGFVYKKDVSSARPGPSEETVCPSCGAKNPQEGIFCVSCGAPLHREKAGPSAQARAGYGPAGAENASPFGGMPGGMPGGMGYNTNTVTMFGDMLSPNEEFDGVTAKDWAKYIGPAAPYYLSCFKRRKEHGRKGLWFVISAVIFGPFYFLYRKMWTAGGILLAVTAALSVPGALLLGADFGLLTLTATAADILTKADFVCMIVRTALLILSALFASDWYRASGAAKIKKLRAVSSSEAEYQQELDKRSGPSKIVLYIGMGLLLIYSFTLMWFLQFA
ncbi:MAG: RING finger protein [Oscillospiraceae bacterium]|nr:RING finger protein [Oscillospiraceae bacterium]